MIPRPYVVAAGLLSATAVGLPTPVRGQTPACEFETTGPMAEPTIAGPDEVTSRVHVISQPESPVEIVAADFTGSDLLIEAGTIDVDYRFRRAYAIEVRNRSDQVVELADVGVDAGFCRAMGRRPVLRPWRGTLAPGETARVEASGTGSSSGGGRPDQVADLRVWVWINQVEFGACTYRPAQIIPRSLCVDSLPGRPAGLRRWLTPAGRPSGATGTAVPTGP